MLAANSGGGVSGLNVAEVFQLVTWRNMAGTEHVKFLKCPRLAPDGV